jgi:hypothetical protein
MLKPILLAAGAFAAGLTLFAHDAAAGPITVLNPSFESPALAAPGDSNGPGGGITSWTTNSFGTSAAAGVWYLPDAPYYTVNAPDGNQVAFIYSGTGATGGGSITQTTSSLFQANTNYTLSFYAGQLALTGGFTYPDTVDAILYEGSTSNVLATFPVTAPLSGPDSFQLDSFTFSAGINPYASGNIGIEFYSEGVANSMATFDNVSLSASTAAAIPEPASLLFLGAGLIGFAIRRRRAKAPA